MTAALVVLAGVSGSGKTAAGLALATALPIEVLSMDSVQVYRGMDIGSAKPSPEERARAPHHLLDLVDPDTAFSAADWLRAAERALEDIRARERIPLLIGGTGLYLRALSDGFAELPSADAALRAELERSENAVPGCLHAKLSQVDPVSAARIQPRDRLRLVRALEVHALTGRPLSRWLAEHAASRAERRLVHVVIDPPRATLDAAVQQRTSSMLQAGLVAEARALRDRFGNARPLEAVGYKEALGFVDGQLAAAELEARIVQATRQFARRQRTWWRKLANATVVGDAASAVSVLRGLLTAPR